MSIKERFVMLLCYFESEEHNFDVFNRVKSDHTSLDFGKKKSKNLGPTSCKRNWIFKHTQAAAFSFKMIFFDKASDPIRKI